MATFIAVVIIAVLVIFASYQIYKGHKNHTLCSGSCSGCCHSHHCSPKHRDEVHKAQKHC